MPLAGVYTASKTAITGLTGSVTLELAAFDVRVGPEAYMPFAGPIFAAFAQPAAVTTEQDVAEVVWQAANDRSERLRFAAGADAVALASVA
jgi:NAD(P)-dependent dehydrogenase (short-subunit alcohol dehydrogenase family)